MQGNAIQFINLSMQKCCALNHCSLNGLTLFDKSNIAKNMAFGGRVTTRSDVETITGSEV
jgi:hypothetical protein